MCFLEVLERGNIDTLVATAVFLSFLGSEGALIGYWTQVQQHVVDWCALGGSPNGLYVYALSRALGEILLGPFAPSPTPALLSELFTWAGKWCCNIPPAGWTRTWIGAFRPCHTLSYRQLQLLLSTGETRGYVD